MSRDELAMPFLLPLKTIPLRSKMRICDIVLSLDWIEARSRILLLRKFAEELNHFYRYKSNLVELVLVRRLLRTKYVYSIITMMSLVSKLGFSYDEN